MVEWETSYRIGSTPWLRRSANPALQHWFDGRDLTGQRMPVPGCITSLEPALFAAIGALVTGLDIAPSAIAAQRQTFETAGYNGAFVVGDLLSWQSDNHSFDLTPRS
jgi:methyl halide transferase